MSSEDDVNKNVEQSSGGGEPTENAEERGEISWPYTKGDGVLQLRNFDIVDAPNFFEDEAEPAGQLLIALLDEIMHLKGTIAYLVKEHQKSSFEEWLASQGKSLREPGLPTNIMDQMRTKP